MNKLKGSSSAVKMKYLLFVFAAAVLVSLPTRVYQLLALVDATNGFFRESDVTVPVLYGVVVVFGLLFMVLSFISKEVPSPKLPAGKNAVLGIASFVMVAGLGADMLGILKRIVPVNQGNAVIFVNLLKSNLSKNGGAFTILEFVFAFFAIIYFLVFSISHLNGKASYKEFKLLALAPLCWSMTVLVTKLMNAISFIKVSELLFEIFMFVFVMLFFLTFARVSSGVFTEDSMWGIYGYGLTAALLASIVTIPRIVIALVGLDAVEGNEFNFAHLAVFGFIVAYIFASLGIGFKDGLKNRRQVRDIDLPDEKIIVKKDSLDEYLETEEEEIIEEVIAPLESFEEIFEIVDVPVEEPVEEVVEEAIEVAVEESAEEVVEEAIEVAVEEPAEEIVQAVVEEAEDAISFKYEASVEEVVEATVEESAEEVIEEVIKVVVEEPVEEIAEEPIEVAVEEPEEEVAEDVIEFTLESVADATAKEAPKKVKFGDLEYTEATPEAKEKKKSPLFKKTGKTKQAPSRKDAGDSELTAISLADLKNRNNQ